MEQSDEFNITNDVAFSTCKSHAMLSGIERQARESQLKRILDDYFKTKERWKILKEFFETKKIDYWEVLSVEGNILSKLITLIYQLDYTSIYLAVLSNTDPTSIGPIDFIKNRLQ